MRGFLGPSALRRCEICGSEMLRSACKDAKRYATRRFCSRACRQVEQRRSAAAGFWHKLDNFPSAMYWVWKGPTNNKGYGTTSYHGKRIFAHRLAYVLSGGDLLPRDFVLHSCDNPPCCNPAHLRVGSAQDNVNDMLERGRAKNAHKFDDATVAAIRAATGRLVDIASSFGISVSHASSIRRGQSR